MIPPHEIRRSYNADMLDITGAGDIEVLINKGPSGKVMHVNVDGICVMRICRISGYVEIETRTRDEKLQ